MLNLVIIQPLLINKCTNLSAKFTNLIIKKPGDFCNPLIFRTII
jgi:hypothetical protein